VKKIALLVLCLVLLYWAALAKAADVGPTYAIVNCKVVPVSGPALDKGTIIIRDGLIEAVGPAEKIAVPEDAEVIDGQGLTAYPGLLDAHSQAFLEPAREEPAGPARGGPAQAQPGGPQGFTPETQAFKLLKPKKSDLAGLQRLGFTTVLVVPSQGIFAGQSVLLNLNGEKPAAMVVRQPVALHITFATERGVYPSSLMGTMAALRQSFLDTQDYARHQAAWNASPRRFKRPEYSPFLEALRPYVVDKRPVIFTCANQEDIKRAIRLIEEFKLNSLLSGANEAWRVAEAVKRAQVPLLVSLSFKPPLTSLYANQGDELKKKAEEEIYPANAAALFKAGIPFALTSCGLTKVEDILKNTRAAIKAGLPREEALKALTIQPARFLGVESMLGSLEAGKIANIILTSGEIFEEKTQVEKVFVDGQMFSVEKAPPAGAGPGAVSLIGPWQGKIVSPIGELDISLELDQQGSQVSGTAIVMGNKRDISEGVLSGSALTFTIETVIMGQSMSFAFQGTADKDLIEGSLAFPMGSAEVRLTRAPKE
jgi:imidazolonepropionase-like amidohydrolase